MTADQIRAMREKLNVGLVPRVEDLYELLNELEYMYKTREAMVFSLNHLSDELRKLRNERERKHKESVDRNRCWAAPVS